jgi:DNA-binding NarL/FixJ family response regulator
VLAEGDGDADVDALGDGLALEEPAGEGDAVPLLLGDALGDADGSDERVGLGEGDALDVSEGLGVADEDDTSSAAISSKATSSAVPDRGEADARGVGSDVVLSEGDGLVTTSGEGEGERDADDDGMGVGSTAGVADDVLDAEAEGHVAVGVGVALGATSSDSHTGSFKGSRAVAEPTAPDWPTATKVAIVDTRRAPAPRARAQREELTGRICLTVSRLVPRRGVDVRLSQPLSILGYLARSVSPMEARRQVLVIEDDAFLRGLLVEILQTRGFLPHAASDAATAMNLIDQHDPDALIVDLDLGHGPSGVDVIGALGDRLGVFGILVLSNYPSASAVVPGADLPASVGYLLKRHVSDADQVVAALESVLSDTVAVRPDQRESIPAELSMLTRGQLDLLRLIAMGYSNEMIAEKRGTTIRSVESLVHRLFTSLGLSSDPRSNARVNAAMLYARTMGIPRASA